MVIKGNFKEDFVGAIVSCFLNYANFKTRASRTEYWYWALFLFLVYLILTLLGLNFIHTIFQLATIVPAFAVGVRRLHDINLTGWWILIGFTIIGIIPLIYLHCLKSEEKDNIYGKNPLKETNTTPTAPTTPKEPPSAG